MDGITIASLTSATAEIAQRAASTSSELDGLIAAISPNGPANQLRQLSAALQQANAYVAELQQAIKSAAAISERLKGVLDQSLSVCQAATGSLHKQVMRLDSRSARDVDQSFLLAYGIFLNIHGRLFSQLAKILKLTERDAQDANLDITTNRESLYQAQYASVSIQTSQEIFKTSEDDIPPYETDVKEEPEKDKKDAPADTHRAEDAKGGEIPPPYAQPPTTTQISLRTWSNTASGSMQHSNLNKTRSKGFSFTQSIKSFASGIRAKPDPLVSALCQAVTRGDVAQVKGMIAQGANVDGRNENSSTPLKCAVLTNQAECVRLLLDAGANPKQSVSGDPPPLFQAAALGNLEIAKMLLINKTDVRDRNPSGQPYFIHVVEVGNVDGVRFLLDNGADPNWSSAVGQTVLEVALKKKKNSIAKLLVAYGAKNTTTKASDNPALAQAVEKGNVGEIERLLSEGADVNVRTRHGTMVIVQAMSQNRFDIAKLLLDKGADANATDVQSQAILLELITNKKISIEQKISMTRILLQKGANPNAKDAKWNTPPIAHAIATGQAELVEMLLKHGASTKGRAASGHSLLFTALELGRNDLVTLLLDHGADVNEGNDINGTPMKLAVRKGDPQLIKILEDHGASLAENDPVPRLHAPKLQQHWSKPSSVKRNSTEQGFRTAMGYAHAFENSSVVYPQTRRIDHITEKRRKGSIAATVHSNHSFENGSDRRDSGTVVEGTDDGSGTERGGSRVTRDSTSSFGPGQT